jgi:hypothetical protein
MFIGANQSESGNLKRCGNRRKGNELQRHIADRKYHAHLLMTRTNESDWLVNYFLIFKRKKNCRNILFFGPDESFVREGYFSFGAFSLIKFGIVVWKIFKLIHLILCSFQMNLLQFRVNFGKTVDVIFRARVTIVA